MVSCDPSNTVNITKVPGQIPTNHTPIFLGLPALNLLIGAAGRQPAWSAGGPLQTAPSFPC